VSAGPPASTAPHPAVAVVTGASAGIGRATVRELARRGTRLGLVARGREGLEATAAEVERLGGRALVLPADVADADAVEEAARRAEETLGPIDVWVNNAMLSVFSPIRQMAPDEFRRVTEVTYLGVVHGTRAALRRMQPRDSGLIVQVSSALAYRAIPLQSAYCAAKHAVLGFTDSLRCELLHDRSAVRVTMVHLPAVNTPQFDWVRSRLPRRASPPDPLYQPELAARAILYAIDHPRRDVYFGASTVELLYAQQLVPGLVDRYLSRYVWDGQMSSEPEDPERPHNLWQPLPGDHGPHGRFDDRALTRSRQLWATMNRPLLGATAAAGVLAGLFLGARGR
jgi:NAD(P)-dependent dehydrogenase (short-subunit alcohol dehydrogenase family)